MVNARMNASQAQRAHDMVEPFQLIDMEHEIGVGALPTHGSKTTQSDTALQAHDGHPARAAQVLRLSAGSAHDRISVHSAPILPSMQQPLPLPLPPPPPPLIAVARSAHTDDTRGTNTPPSPSPIQPLVRSKTPQHTPLGSLWPDSSGALFRRTPTPTEPAPTQTPPARATHAHLHPNDRVQPAGDLSLEQQVRAIQRRCMAGE